MSKSKLCKMGHIYFNGHSRHNNRIKIIVSETFQINYKLLCDSRCCWLNIMCHKVL